MSVSPVAIVLLAGLIAIAFAHRRWPSLARNLMVPVSILLVFLTLRDVFTIPSVPLKDQPSPDAQEYAEGTDNMARGRGFFVSAEEGSLIRSRYPPGFSVALLPFATDASKFPANVQGGATTYTALYVLISFITAWRIGGSVAAGLTALFLDVAPFTWKMAGLILSDPLGATLTIAIALVLSFRESRARAIIAGLLSGASGLVRTALVTNVPSVILSLRKHRLAALIAAGLVLGILAGYQWRAFGSPFKTGYDTYREAAFHPRWAVRTPPRSEPWIVGDLLEGRLLQFVCPCPEGGPQAALPNILFYPAVLLGLFWTVSPPFVNAVGIYAIIRRRHEASARFTLILTGSQLLLLTLYFYQSARFMAAPATLLLIFSNAEFARWLIGSRDGATERNPRIGKSRLVKQAGSETGAQGRN